jgi:hypothetical protein
VEDDAAAITLLARNRPKHCVLRIGICLPAGLGTKSA